jgi:hypothetical protein
MRQRQPTHLAHHSHGVAAGNLRDIDDPISFEHREVRALTQLVRDLLEVGCRPVTEKPVGGSHQPREARAEGVAAGGFLPDIAQGDEGADHSMHARLRQVHLDSQLREPYPAAGIRHRLQQLEGTLHGVDAGSRGDRPGVVRSAFTQQGRPLGLEAPNIPQRI